MIEAVDGDGGWSTYAAHSAETGGEATGGADRWRSDAAAGDMGAWEPQHRRTGAAPPHRAAAKPLRTARTVTWLQGPFLATTIR